MCPVKKQQPRFTLLTNPDPIYSYRILERHEETVTQCKILQELIASNRFTAWFQPIVSLENESIYAHEALCRTSCPTPFATIDKLFAKAHAHGLTLELDMLCRENALYGAASLGIDNTESLLFINICPSTLLHPEHIVGKTEALVRNAGLNKERIVLEITEQEAVTNYDLFKKTIDHYRNSGFQIAIDDFGAGYGGLKMLSVLEPDYVKIDRHFFENSRRSNINYNLIDAVSTACHRIGIDVIAEGIESDEELNLCREVGIKFLQGYYFAKPAPRLAEARTITFSSGGTFSSSSTEVFDEVICTGDICSFVEPVPAESRALDLLSRFNDAPDIECIPVMSGNVLCGLVNRRRFMENHMVGRFGYGLSLNYYKTVGEIVEDSFLQVPHYTSVEEVARKIRLRQHVSIYDDVCVTRSGQYLGTVSVSEILSAVTENSMLIAKGANPLTGLPGNEFIQRQIARMLSQSIHFDVCYIDIDNFKPFNDCRGFDMGDRVIKSLGNLLQKAVKKWDKSEISFAGHIGGDDFIILSRPKHSVKICEYIIDSFTRSLPLFHSGDECERGSYSSVNRKGNIEHFNLLSLSIGIVSTEVHHISSVAAISSIASELKKRAKAISGSVIVRDRREAVIIVKNEEGEAITRIDDNSRVTAA